MSLTDPTGGGGYSFGEKLPSAHMTTIATQQPNAWDIIGGGTHAANATSTITDGGSGAITFSLPVTVSTSGSITWDGLANHPKVASQTVIRYQDAIPVKNTFGNFVFDLVGGAWDQDDVSTAGLLVIPIANRPPVGTLTQVGVVIDGNGAGASHSSLPGASELPAAQVFWREGIVTNSSTKVFATPADLAAYEVTDSITVSGLSIDVANAHNIHVHITGEFGANAQAGALRVSAIIAYFTVTEIAP